MSTDHVSFETAKALKDAGYPQPTEISHGGYFYKFDARLMLSVGGEPRMQSEVVCPTLTDLLNHLGPGYKIRALGLGEFECSRDGNPTAVITNNPCETLARWIVDIETRANNRKAFEDRFNATAEFDENPF